MFIFFWSSIYKTIINLEIFDNNTLQKYINFFIEKKKLYFFVKYINIRIYYFLLFYKKFNFFFIKYLFNQLNFLSINKNTKNISKFILYIVKQQQGSFLFSQKKYKQINAYNNSKFKNLVLSIFLFYFKILYLIYIKINFSNFFKLNLFLFENFFKFFDIFKNYIQLKFVYKVFLIQSSSNIYNSNLFKINYLFNYSLNVLKINNLFFKNKLLPFIKSFKLKYLNFFLNLNLFCYKKRKFLFLKKYLARKRFPKLYYFLFFLKILPLFLKKKGINLKKIKKSFFFVLYKKLYKLFRRVKKLHKLTKRGILKYFIKYFYLFFKIRYISKMLKTKKALTLVNKNPFKFIKKHILKNYLIYKKLIGFIIFNRSKNNFFLTVTSFKGKVLLSRSIGNLHMLDSKKSLLKNPITYTSLALRVCKKLMFKKVFCLIVKVICRISKRSISKFISKLLYSGFILYSVQIAVPLSHNGLRLKKKRRL